MTKRHFTFGQLSFSSGEELTQYCDNLRLSCSPGKLIEGADNHELLKTIAMASYDTHKRFKGQPITGWTTKKNTADGQGLAAILKDGRCVSFSAKKAVENYVILEESDF